jgi:hypothetical protein
MEMTEDSRSTHTKTCTSTTLSNINPTGTGLLASSDLCDERPATNRLSHGTPCPMQTYIDTSTKNCIYCAFVGSNTIQVLSYFYTVRMPRFYFQY